MSRVTDPVSSPSVIKWSKSLRSRSPSPTRSADYGGTLGTNHVTDTRTSSLKKSDVASRLRSSIGSLGSGNLMSTGKSKGTGFVSNNIEAEYIKNLQQQIYFLELEANFLREQARRATDLHPHMTREAEKMLEQLTTMEKALNSMREEVKSKDTLITASNTQNDVLLRRLRDEEDMHQREKHTLTEQMITLKKDKDRLERELARKDNQVQDAKIQLDQSSEALQAAEQHIKNLKSQLQHKNDQHIVLQQILEEKRSHLNQAEAKLVDVGGKLSSTSVQHEKSLSDLRTEIQTLKKRVEDMEFQTEKDDALRKKMIDDNDRLIEENTRLREQVEDIRTDLAREQHLREAIEQRQNQQITELVTSRDRESAVRIENDQLRDQLHLETEKSKSYLEELTKMTSKSTANEVHLRTKTSQLSDLQAHFTEVDAENAQLRKDKTLLIDHVADIQSKLEEKDTNLHQLQTAVHALEGKLKEYQFEQDMEHSKQSQKWEEFSRLAESMRTLSRSMAVHTASSKTNSPQKPVLQY